MLILPPWPVLSWSLVQSQVFSIWTFSSGEELGRPECRVWQARVRVLVYCSVICFFHFSTILLFHFSLFLLWVSGVVSQRLLLRNLLLLFQRFYFFHLHCRECSGATPECQSTYSKAPPPPLSSTVDQQYNLLSSTLQYFAATVEH